MNFWKVVLLAGLVMSGCTADRTLTAEVGSRASAQGSAAVVVDTKQPVATLSPVPTRKVLVNDYHIFQTFNNCGPASLSMALAYYGITKSQKELGEALRPYQVAGGDNDDKSVTLAELAEQAKEYGLQPYYRVGGSVEVLEKLIALDLPVVTRTWLKKDDDIGHYRVVKGYDRTARTLVQDDSLQGKNLTYGYEEFEEIWRKFGYEFLVLVPSDKVSVVEQALGELVDEQVAWQQAVTLFENELRSRPQDANAGLQLAVALYHVGEYQRSVQEFEKVEARLPFRAMWYQIEPIQSYFALKDYDRVMALTEKILNNQNRAFSELYYLRGKVWQERGQSEMARREFEKSVEFNRGFELGKQAIGGL